MKSWGGITSRPGESYSPKTVDQAFGLVHNTLVAGSLRSYGDVCLPTSGTVVLTNNLNLIKSFDRENGILRCEAGVTLGEISRVITPHGWRLPVVPGTQYLTVGGAIANDIHGKNHHGAGTFGCHCRSMLLLRSQGELLNLSIAENSDLFAATIGGMGLTGMIVEAEIQLTMASTSMLDIETIAFGNLSEFHDLDDNSNSNFEYTVAWFDCLHRYSRGIYQRANFSESIGEDATIDPVASIPVDLPFSPLNSVSLSVFNWAYYQLQRRKPRLQTLPFSRWMYPLDRISNWNRLYGRAGFRQFQCVVKKTALPDLLDCIRSTGEGSFLAVLKTFGDKKSPGLLSFPRPGVSLALDFPWRGKRTVDLFRRLHEIVSGVDGAIYPAKDAHMSENEFKAAYPDWRRLCELKDPEIESMLWRRVAGTQ